MSKIQLYEVIITTTHTFETEKTVYVMGSSTVDAQKEAKLLKIDTSFTYTDMLGQNVKTSRNSVKVKNLKAIKGKKRPQLSKTQMIAINSILDNTGKESRLTYHPGAGWIATAPNKKDSAFFLENRTLKALVSKNLLIPVSMTSKERTAQNALGLIEPGQISLKLNMEQIRKRKVFQEVLK